MSEVREYDLPGVRTHDLRVIPDERGFFSEAARSDWGELLEGDEIAQVNISLSYPGIIRAWHRHLRGQVDYFLVLQGAMKICACDDRVVEQDDTLVHMPGDSISVLSVLIEILMQKWSWRNGNL